MVLMTWASSQITCSHLRRQNNDPCLCFFFLIDVVFRFLVSSRLWEFLSFCCFCFMSFLTFLMLILFTGGICQSPEVSLAHQKWRRQIGCIGRCTFKSWSCSAAARDVSYLVSFPSKKNGFSHF